MPEGPIYDACQGQLGRPLRKASASPKAFPNNLSPFEKNVDDPVDYDT